MAGANSNIQMTELDFNQIKQGLKTYLQSQDTLRDYNYEGSALSTLLDVLAYNTQYNAYYLNQVANEMFLDTAQQRSSVVSHAKLLNYTPKSAIAPSATINLRMNNVTNSSLTLPAYTTFLSESIEGINYKFVTVDSKTVETDLIAETATFNNLELKQGNPVNYTFTINTSDNPKHMFTLPDTNIDTSTLKVTVQKSFSNNYTEVYTESSNKLLLDGTSQVFFIQEGLTGNYEIYFGDGILGKRLSDGNIVIVNYLVTNGTAAAGANSFVLMDSVGGFSSATITNLSEATAGADKETIDSIKYQAPKAFAAQNRAVTKDDYITIIQQNKLGIPFDAVSVWGGQENETPAFGQVFIALKPAGSYVLTDTQKQRIIRDVIKPICVLTVTPTIVDPDYTYIKLKVNAIYDPSKTTLSAEQIRQNISNTINNFSNTTLNTFNSTFKNSDLIAAIQATNNSIVTNEISIQLQKKFKPNFSLSQTYKLDYKVALERGVFLTGINSSPAMKFQNPSNIANYIDGVYLEEVPTNTGGVESISLINPGFNYTLTPTVQIIGDGTGAEAVAVLDVDNTIKQINVTSTGSGYTTAYVKIINNSNDKSGQLASAVPILQGRYGTLRTYYNDASSSVKIILNNNVGTIDYETGVITLTDFNPTDVNDPLGQLTVTVKPSTTLISSTYNKILTIDPFDPNSITVNVTPLSK